jgi:hypothetical protein
MTTEWPDDRDSEDVLAVELTFIDPGVPQLPVLLHTLRPGVVGILLSKKVPVARQIAMATAERHDLAAVHVIAHGAPGQVHFGAGDWSLDTLINDASDLAAIGQALAPDGEFCLWSCETATGVEGAVFVAGLAQATGAAIAAAEGRIGAAAQGGGWRLATRPGLTARPPLTDAGVSAYAGVLAAFEITITGTLPSGDSTGIVTYFIIETTKRTIVGHIMLPDAARQNNSVAITVKVPTANASYAVGTFESGGNFQASSFLSVSSPGGHQPRGAVGPSGG